MLNDHCNCSDNRSHDRFRDDANFSNESLRINSTQLQCVNRGGLAQTIGAIWHQPDMPEVMGKVFFPLRQRSYQPNRQYVNGIRVYHNYGTGLSDFSAESRVEAH